MLICKARCISFVQDTNWHVDFTDNYRFNKHQGNIIRTFEFRKDQID